MWTRFDGTVYHIPWCQGDLSYTIDWYSNGAFFAITTTPSVSFVKQQANEFIYARIYPAARYYDSAFSADILISTVTSVSQFAQNENLSVYLNPFSNELTVTGRILVRKDAESEKEIVDSKEFAAGYYIIKLFSKDGRVKGKIPVMKR